jgi:hypothetical protein
VRTDAEIVFLLSGLVLIVLIFLAALAMLYVAYFCAADILKNLSNSPAVIARKNLLGWNPIGRFLFISCVGSLIIFSRNSLKNGDLDKKDYECFPVGLRRKIKIVNGLMLGLGVISIVGVIIGKFKGWLA